MEPQCRSVIVLPLFTSCFETGSLTAAEALTQRFSSESSKCWDYRCEPTHLVQVNGTAGLLIDKGIEQFSCISWQFYSFLLLVIHDCQLEHTVGSQKTWSWFSLFTCKWVLRMQISYQSCAARVITSAEPPAQPFMCSYSENCLFSSFAHFT